jgi:hypothetical protein
MKQQTRRAASSGPGTTFGDFVCIVCHNFISAESALSGVHNRNHCPYCLSSRHLDMVEAGDRLSACKAAMRPVALTMKKTVKKYVRNGRPGEMMLVHVCDDCGKISINRIAADDSISGVLEIFEGSWKLAANTRLALARSGVMILEAGEQRLVKERLMGREGR